MLLHLIQPKDALNQAYRKVKPFGSDIDAFKQNLLYLISQVDDAKEDQILSLKKDNPQAQTSALEREIDLMVNELYGLSEEEIDIVEGGLIWKSIYYLLQFWLLAHSYFLLNRPH